MRIEDDRQRHVVNTLVYIGKALTVCLVSGTK